MSGEDLAALLFWAAFLAAASWETGFVLKRTFPFVARVCPGFIGRFLVQGMAQAYAGNANLTLDFEWIFSDRPIGLSGEIYREMVALLQLLLMGSWLSIFISAMIDTFVW